MSEVEKLLALAAEIERDARIDGPGSELMHDAATGRQLEAWAARLRAIAADKQAQPSGKVDVMLAVATELRRDAAETKYPHARVAWIKAAVMIEQARAALTAASKGDGA